MFIEEDMNKIINGKSKTLNLKTFILVLSMGLILFGLFLINTNKKVQAASVSDLQKKQTEISQQIKNNQDKAKQNQKDINQASGDIKSLDNDIFDIEQKISDTENKISDTESQIKTKESEIAQKEKELAVQKTNQQETIRTIYEMQKLNNPLRMLFSNLTLSQTINHNTYLDALEGKIEATMDEISKLKRDLETQKTDLENTKKNLENLREQDKAYKRGLDDQKNIKEKILSNKQSQQRSLEEQIAESKKLQNQVEAEIARAMAAANSSGRSVIARDRGVSDVGFMWPMDYKYLSAYYGDSTPFQSFHSGIDLANIPGTPVYASAKGTITTAASMQIDGNYYGYGNYIVIGHNARFSSLYAHLMSFAVSVGQDVEQGQIIGYEGNTGWSTGPHLHYEIWEYGQRRNPISYLP